MAIIPNLMVTDMTRSLAFYRDLLGMEVAFALDAQQNMLEGTTSGAVFAQLTWAGERLMLQTRESLASELSAFDQAPVDQTAVRPWGTLYLRDYPHRELSEAGWKPHHLKGPEKTWYGMNELYLRDPDGHVVCLGFPEGEPPTS